ncbi:MAG: MFS transporter [Actinobacteria bacterium]|nr:MFS transporter [Actinomycetota bacterium]
MAPQEIVICRKRETAARVMAPARPLGRGYWMLWTAATVSNIGDGVRYAALPLLAVTLTHDPVLVAGTVFAAQLPWLLFALISGALVDRLNRRTVMVVTNLLRAIVIALLGVLVLGGIESLALVYVMVFLLGTAETLFDSASFALLPALVDQDDLERANGPMQAAVTFNQEFVGPPLGAFLFAALAALPFFVDAASFALAAAIVVPIKGDFSPQNATSGLGGLRWPSEASAAFCGTSWRSPSRKR